MDKKIPAELLERIQFKKPNSHNPQPDQPIEYIKFNEYSCPDCDKTIQQAKHTIKKYLTPEPHFRTRCENCMYTKDPETGEYTVHSAHTNRRFLDYFTKKE